MTSKEQALYAIMEDRQYSPGAIQATLQVCNHSKEDLDDLIIRVSSLMFQFLVQKRYGTSSKVLIIMSL